MSSEFENIEPGLQQDLQPVAPSAANGEPNGPEPPDSPAIPPTPDVGQPPAPTPLRSGPAQAALDAALRGEPGTLPMTWCKKCGVDVKPQGKGQCPRCGQMLRLNFSRRTHPVNVLRRNAILANLEADYAPRNTMQRAQCQHLAAILEQLEALKPGSPDHQRLVQLSQLLGAALEETRPAAIPHHEDLSALSETELRARLVRMRDKLDGMIDASAPVETVDVPNTRDAGRPVAEGGTPSEPLNVTPEPAPPQCHLCHQPLAACTAMRTQKAEEWRLVHPCAFCGKLGDACDALRADRHTWRLLHYNHPEEIDRRQKEDFDTMMKTMSHGSGVTRW